MKKTIIACQSLAGLALGCMFSIVALAADGYVVPRTEWGQPDLQGVWNFSSNTPMQRPSRYGDRQFLTPEEVRAVAEQRAARDASNDGAIAVEGVDGSYNDFWVENAGIGGDVRTSHIVYPSDGRLPALVEGAIANQGVYGGDTTGESRPVRISAGGIGTDGPEDRGLSERCLIGFNAGPPFIPSLYNNNVQIFQSKDTAVILTEMIHDARIVPLDGRDHIDDSIRQWSGDSRGYWDGDTLVVETRNFNDLTQSFSVFGSSFDKVLTEKFTRVDEFTVDYEFTVEDPSTFKDKITVLLPMAKVDGLMYEYACHEGNYSMVGALRGARAQEAQAAQQEAALQ
mgnify:CR=1 FL=1